MYTRLHAHDGVVGKGIKFERIRRVTGYLVGTLDRFNDAKRAEVNDRVKHMHVSTQTQNHTTSALQPPAVPAA